MSKEPMLSVVMPVYNSAAYVADAIHSILVQSYPHFEFIVVDDGSTDGSPEVVAEFARQDARIRPLFLPHGGVAAALNAGVALAQGELIARMDADDIALPDRFAIQLDWMGKTGVDVCGGSALKFGADNGILWVPERHRDICHELLFRIGLLHPTLLIQAPLLKSHLYHEQAVHEDYELWTRLALDSRLGNVPQILIKHRRHFRQVCVTHGPLLRADIRQFRQPYFHKLFPDSTAADYHALATVAEKEGFRTLTELALAGDWLLRLGQTEDNHLRGWMLHRWRGACLRSAQLGPGCYRLYQRVAKRFQVDSAPSDRQLWLLCALRLSSRSRLRTALAFVRQKARSLRVA